MTQLALRRAHLIVPHRIVLPERVALGDEFFVFGETIVCGAKGEYAGPGSYDECDLTLDCLPGFKLVPLPSRAQLEAGS